MADMAPMQVYKPKTKKAGKPKVKIAAKRPKVKVAPVKAATKTAPIRALSILDSDNDGM